MSDSRTASVPHCDLCGKPIMGWVTFIDGMSVHQTCWQYRMTRTDAPSETDWLARFRSKVGLGACICEGQEISAANAEIERLTAALQHEADCVEAAKAEIERLTEENRRLRADLLAGRNVVNAGLTIHTLTIERDMLRQEIERLTAALQYEQHRAGRQGTHGDGCADWGPEHYECAIRERDELRRQLDPMGEYASADELIAALRAEKAEDEAMKQDARRYRDWLRGGANIPPESTRWARWEVRYWDGRHWITLFAEQMDTAIDAAMGLTRPAEAS